MRGYLWILVIIAALALADSRGGKHRPKSHKAKDSSIHSVSTSESDEESDDDTSSWGGVSAIASNIKDEDDATSSWEGVSGESGEHKPKSESTLWKRIINDKTSEVDSQEGSQVEYSRPFRKGHYDPMRRPVFQENTSLKFYDFPAPDPCIAGNRTYCLTCENASSMQDCSRKGTYEICTETEPVCEIVLKIGSGVTEYSRGCQQRKSCSAKRGCKATGKNRICTLCRKVDRREKCTEACYAGLRRQCFTCFNETSLEACMLNGQWVTCNQFDPMCVTEAIRGASDDDIIGISKMCGAREKCDYRSFGAKPGYCQDLEPDSDEQLGSNPQRFCTRCTPIHRNQTCTGGPETCMCEKRNYCLTCYNASDTTDCKDNGVMMACHQPNAVCEMEIVEYRDGELKVNRMCKDRSVCEALESDQMKCSQSEDPAILEICTECQDFDDSVDCEEACINGKTSKCLTCHNVHNMTQCEKEGVWIACPQSQPICETEFHKDADSVQQLTRRCRSRNVCEDDSFKLDEEGHCYNRTNQQGEICTICEPPVQNGTCALGVGSRLDAECPRSLQFMTRECTKETKGLNCRTDRDCQNHDPTSMCCFDGCGMNCIGSDELVHTFCREVKGQLYHPGEMFMYQDQFCRCGADGAPQDCQKNCVEEP